MKQRNLLVICVLSLAIMLVACGKPGNNQGGLITPTSVPTAKPTETEKSEKEKALAAYDELLKDAPAISGDLDELFDISMDYEQNLVKFGEHYDNYAYYDINQDGIPELIATTTINHKWAIVYVFTYANGKVVLLDDPTDTGAQGTFDQNATVNGAYSLYFCDGKHIHNVWKGETPIGEVEENHACALEGTKLKEAECTITGSDKIVSFFDIAKPNEYKSAAPTPTEPVVSRKIKVDYYKVPELYSKAVSESDMTAFKKVVEAWLNYEPKVKVDTPSKQDNLWGMLQESFFLVYGDFDEDKGFSYDQEYIYFPYVSKNKAEHDAIIAAFEERVNSFFVGIGEDETGVDLARHIYINYNKTISYDYDIYDKKNFTFANASGYTAMMKGTGVCMSFAKAYSYLLRQAGIESFCVSGLPDRPGIDSHEWSALKIGDKYYFADPTWDYKSAPEQYEYFCFGLDKRAENGYPENLMHICENGDIPLSKFVKIEHKDLQ